MRESNRITENRLSILLNKLMKLWIRAHGYEKAKASVLEGHERLVAIIIDDAFTPAEIHLANQSESRWLIREYAEQLIELIKPQMVSCVDEFLGCKVVGYSINPNLINGSVLCLFQLENQVSERFD
ncbi:MAG: DUF2294 domain-containing protein [Anaerolineales bacterium]|nr:DUF2294 domain-containing protein [Anaerolineales bacterium]